jgi:hypothetical protein
MTTKDIIQDYLSILFKGGWESCISDSMTFVGPWGRQDGKEV